MSDDLDQLLVGLKLTRMRAILGRELAHAEAQGPSYSDFLARLLREEYQSQQERFMQYRIDRAGLPERWSLDTYPWDLQPGVRKAALLPLASLDLLARAKSRAGQYTYTAPALNAELSNWFPPMPFALLSSRGAPTAMVLPSPDSATLEPKLSPPSLLDALT